MHARLCRPRGGIVGRGRGARGRASTGDGGGDLSVPGRDGGWDGAVDPSTGEGPPVRWWRVADRGSGGVRRDLLRAAHGLSVARVERGRNLLQLDRAPSFSRVGAGGVLRRLMGGGAAGL